MAHHHVAIVIAQMEAITLTIAEHVALGTLALPHPLAVPIQFETVVPHIPEAVAIDVSLVIVAAYAQASRNRPIASHTRHC